MKWPYRILLSTTSNSNTTILLSIWKCLGQSKYIYIFFKSELSNSCLLCIMVLDVMMLRLEKPSYDCNFNEWELESYYLAVSGFSRSGNLKLPSVNLGENPKMFQLLNKRKVNTHQYAWRKLWSDWRRNKAVCKWSHVVRIRAVTLQRFSSLIGFSPGLFFNPVMSFYAPSLVVTHVSHS